MHLIDISIPSLCSFPFSTHSGVRQQNDSLLMIYYHDQVVAIGKSISMEIQPTKPIEIQCDKVSIERCCVFAPFWLTLLRQNDWRNGKREKSQAQRRKETRLAKRISETVLKLWNQLILLNEIDCENLRPNTTGLHDSIDTFVLVCGMNVACHNWPFIFIYRF